MDALKNMQADTWMKVNGAAMPLKAPVVPVTVAKGDGVGPEIMDAVLFLLQEAGARLELEPISVGESVYRQGITSGITPEAWASLRRTGIFLKAPITTPQGGGYKSLNVTIRKTLGLFANVRPCRTYHPFVEAPNPGIDLVIVRENEEDTYAGIEHRQTAEVTQCLKLISAPGTAKILKYAFEYARANGRKKVTCLTKDNIMKITDGLFHRMFDAMAKDYPEIETEHRIIDIGAALIARRPDRFDVVVCPNLYGDIVSDIAAEQAGSVGLAGSMNIGEHCAMFEAVHGSAPDIAGQDKANPSGLLQAAILMLQHIGQGQPAALLQNAWLKTLEDGVLTADMQPRIGGGEPVGTKAFARAVATRLGQQPDALRPAAPAKHAMPATWNLSTAPKPVKRLAGVDVFLDWDEHQRHPGILGARVEAAAKGTAFGLKMITNRGVKVYPEGHRETFCTDHWRCRFTPGAGGTVTHRDITALLNELAAAGFDFVKTEHLYTFDGDPGYSLGQGE